MPAIPCTTLPGQTECAASPLTLLNRFKLPSPNPHNISSPTRWLHRTWCKLCVSGLYKYLAIPNFLKTFLFFFGWNSCRLLSGIHLVHSPFPDNAGLIYYSNSTPGVPTFLCRQTASKSRSEQHPSHQRWLYAMAEYSRAVFPGCRTSTVLCSFLGHPHTLFLFYTHFKWIHESPNYIFVRSTRQLNTRIQRTTSLLSKTLIDSSIAQQEWVWL